MGVKALVVMTHSVERNEIVERLRLLSNVEVVHEAFDGHESFKKIVFEGPDLVFWDKSVELITREQLCNLPSIIGKDIRFVFVRNQNMAFSDDWLPLGSIINFPYCQKTIEDLVNESFFSKINVDAKFFHSVNGFSFRGGNKVRFNNMQGFVLIHPLEIFYAEADGNYSRVVQTDALVEIVCQNLLCMENKLKPYNFLRISRSFLINLEYIAGFDRKKRHCVMKYGDLKKTIPVPAERVKELIKIF